MALPILIIGGGLGGLCLAQGLKKANVPFHVFEKDTTNSYRAQGYRIRINDQGGIALKTNLSPEVWKIFEASCAEARPGMTSINPLDGKTLENQDRANLERFGRLRTPNPLLRPYSADRATLRSTLMIGIEDDISFGKEFTHFTTDETSITAHFKGGTSSTGSFLVAADGVRSKVRRQAVPNSILVDTDGRAIYGKTTITPELEQRFPTDAMRCITLMADNANDTPLSLFLEPIRFPAGDPSTIHDSLPAVPDYIYWVLVGRSEIFATPDEQLLSLSGSDAAALSLHLTRAWDPSIRSVLELQNEEQSSILRIASALPDMESWSPSNCVTLLGDSIHAMSPTGGIGASTAFHDAVELCKVFVAAKEGAGVSVDAVGRYEEDMRERAGKIAIPGSLMGGKRIFGQRDFAECKVLEP